MTISLATYPRFSQPCAFCNDGNAMIHESSERWDATGCCGPSSSAPSCCLVGMSMRACVRGASGWFAIAEVGWGGIYEHIGSGIVIHCQRGCGTMGGVRNIRFISLYRALSSSNAYTQSGPPTSKYTHIEIRIILLIRSGFPTYQNGRQFNEDLPNWGYPPVPGTKSQDG